MPVSPAPVVPFALRPVLIPKRGAPFAILLSMLALVTSACIASDEALPPDGAESREPTTAVRIEAEIVVFAAASLTDAFAELAEMFETANPSIGVQLSFAGSSALREQILDGAPVDVFASADEGNIAAVVAAELARGQARVLARNRMVVAVPEGNPAEISGLADLADDALLVGLCAPTVPCGATADRALLAAGVEARPDTLEPDVRSLATKIAVGELDAGVVYASDVVAFAGDLEIVEVVAGDEATTRYHLVGTAGGDEPAAADQFIALVLGPDGQRVLERYGFDAS